MRGKRLASCLLVEAADRYRAVIALAEIDPASLRWLGRLSGQQSPRAYDQITLHASTVYARWNSTAFVQVTLTDGTKKPVPDGMLYAPKLIDAL